ncbi:unnamed protein product [Thelazia callipaeda]|uniref:B30.2/SPRY domain-containing protein n=1 Tax=Thelazia callipaeda TaxID=103827 RepID=A0A0N5CJU9_THECL|nr:unnamed protein product [Thelazia callipaeda]
MYPKSCLYLCLLRFHSRIFQDLNDAPLPGFVEVKSLSPDPMSGSTRPRYKVICAGERPREINERLQLLYPFVDQKKTLLPLHWSNYDKAPSLVITNDYRNVAYSEGAVSTQELNAKDAAAVRSDHPIPITCGVYYFEVTIVCGADECCMGIGLCERNVDLNRLPGWDRASYGYHGDDGNFFCSSGTGHPYGPTFKMNDVIGCGIDLVRKSIFFTKNGRNLAEHLNSGVAIKDVPNVVDLYPMVGLQKHGAIADSNFGQLPFMYDIDRVFQDARRFTYEQISQTVLPQAKTSWMDRAISSWLLHEGYGRALSAFNKHADRELVPRDVDMERVQEESKDTLEKRRGLYFALFICFNLVLLYRFKSIRLKIYYLWSVF